MAKMIEINTYELTDEEAFALIPDYFYKYTRISENLKNNLQNGELWFASANTFNDPFDCKAYINFGLTEEECRSNFDKYNAAFNIELPDINRKVWDVLLQKPKDFNLVNSLTAQRIFEESFGITCFSENYKNTLMWAHYADSHKGIVLEFQKDINGLISRNIVPVIYHSKHPVINVGDYKQEEMLAIAYQLICAKGKDWKYEKELRAISTTANTLQKFNKDELVGVIFGLSTLDSDKREIYEIVNSSGYQNIKFRVAQFTNETFKITYEDYNFS